jgi:hypothetical protein
MARAPAQKSPNLCPKGRLFLEFESSSPEGRGVFFARVPAEHTIEDVLHPSYFGAMMKDKGLREGDLIDIEPESGLWRIQGRVMAVVPALQQVEIREFETMRQNYEVEPPAGYEFKWLGGASRWAILKGAVTVDAGFTSQGAALARVQELQRDKAA